jgi:conjugative relaxase-like TrwC/TraI family protein
MISISLMSGSSTGDYYTSLGAEDYYVNGGEPPGEWYGKGTPKLGLEGKVHASALRNLLLGFSANGSVKLVQNAGSANCQSGWDLTYNAPKSVSVYWAMSSPEVRQVIQSLQNRAVKASLDLLEKKYLFTRTGAQGRKRERVSLVAALFEHGTSRAQDPHLHTHALVLSRSPRALGKVGTLVSNLIYENKRELDREYCRELSRLLETELGLEIRRSRGNFAIESISQSVCSHFSKRRWQILQHAAEFGAYTPQVARIAALKTRPKKEIIPRGLFFERCETQGRAIGFGPEQARELLNRAKKIEEPKDSQSAGRLDENQRTTMREKREVAPTPVRQRPYPSKHRIQKKGEKAAIIRPAPTKQKQPPQESIETPPWPTDFSEAPVSRKSSATKIDPNNANRTATAREKDGPSTSLGASHPIDSDQGPPETPPWPEDFSAAPVPKTALPQKVGHQIGLPLAKRHRPNAPVPAPDALTPFEPVLARFRKLVTILPKVVTPPHKLQKFGQSLFRIPFTKYEVRLTQRQLLRNAPSWSPLRKLRSFAIVREFHPLPRRPKWVEFAGQRSIGPVTVNLERRLIAPRASRLSPLFGVRAKVLTVGLRPSLKSLADLRNAIARKHLPAFHKRPPPHRELGR